MSPTREIREAAIVLNSLPDDTMHDVLERLDDDSRRQLMDSMDSLEQISGEEFHRASRRFRKQTLGDHQSFVENVAASLPIAGKAKVWPTDSLGVASVGAAPFDFLTHLDSNARRRLLEAEHPLNVAMMMTALSPAQASAITRELDPGFRVSVIRRLCNLDAIDEAKIMELRYSLRMRARRMLAIEHCTGRGLAVAADLLSVSDRQTQDSVIAWLSDRDRELGEELERRVMTMKDLVDFSDEELLKLLKRVDTTAWAGALRSTIPSVAKRVLCCMAPKASQIVNSEMAAFDPLDEKAVQWSVEKVMTEAVKLRKEIPGADKPSWRVASKR